MKRMRWLSCIFIVLIAGMLTNVFAGSEHHFDKKGYEKIVKKTIGGIITGNVNVDSMLADMDKLIKIGVAGCEEHMGEAETPQNEIKIMKATIENAQKMKLMSLEEIEGQWHEGGFLQTKGIDINAYDHFSEVLCHYDAIVHPATAYICFQEYRKTKNEDLLEQAKAELSEVREHLQHLE